MYNVYTYDGGCCAECSSVIDHDVLWGGVERGLTEQTIVESSCIRTGRRRDIRMYGKVIGT